MIIFLGPVTGFILSGTGTTPGFVMFIVIANFSSELKRGDKPGPAVNSSAVNDKNLISLTHSLTSDDSDSTGTSEKFIYFINLYI